MSHAFSTPAGWLIGHGDGGGHRTPSVIVAGGMNAPALCRTLLALPLVVLGCDSGTAESQRLFEDQALLAPAAGITEISPTGTVVSSDPDDWRTAPLFIGIAQILDLPTPNPVEVGDAVSFLVDTQGVAGGMALFVRLIDPATGAADLRRVRDPGATRGDATTPGFYTFSVSAGQIALSGPGLYRVVLLDGRQNVISYGDIEVRG
ncbi:MAG: hypothetical protein AAGK21_10520 [Bacteroidota bacterium]